MRPEVEVRREVRLGVSPDFVVPSLEKLASTRSLHLDRDADVDLDGATTDQGEARFTSEHLDTADLRLVRRGVTLQRRQGDTTSWILEVPRPTKNGSKRADCRLIEVDDDSAEPPGVLVDLLTAYTRGTPLEEVAHLQTTRHTRALRDPDARLVAQVDDDTTAVYHGNRVAARFRHLEVDVGPGAPAELLDSLVTQLRDAGASAPDPIPTLVRALGPRALTPTELERPDVGPGSTVGETVQAAMIAAVNLLLDHDHVVRLDDDIEGVHQARVGTRRLRSYLRAYKRVFDADWVGPLSADLKWLAGVLGAVRDCDVLSIRLRHAADELPVKSDRRVATDVLQRLSTQRDDAQRSLVEALQSDRYRSLLDATVEAVLSPKFTGSADRAAAELLPAMVKKPFRKVRKAVDRVGLDPTDEELHDLRIDVKRARYAGEVATPVVGPDMRAFAKALAAFGDLLGDHHDASVAEEWLRDAARHVPDGSSERDGRNMALVAGQLIAAQRDERRAIRRDLPAAWEHVVLALPPSPEHGAST